MNDGLRWVVTQFHLDTRFVDAMPFSYMKPLSGSGSKAMMIYFFSSRRRHTIYWRDWSSDVCSSDLRDSVRSSDLPDHSAPSSRFHWMEIAGEIGRAHLNSSHANISYAVFCLKKKKKENERLKYKKKKKKLEKQQKTLITN